MLRRVVSSCAAALVTAAVVGASAGCGLPQPKPGTVKDEAMRAGVTPEQLVRPTDGLLPRHGLQPGPREPAGVHAGGNRRPQHVAGLDRRRRSPVGPADDRQPRDLRPAQDHLVASQHERLDLRRAATDGTTAGRISDWSTNRASRKPTGPDPNRFGLWLDVRDPNCPPDPFADATKYPGVKIGARGKTVPVGSYYGEPTGIVGLRLFPNPDFDEKARRALELGAVLQRSVVLLRPQARPAVPRRHVVRVLSRRAEPDQAAGRSREPEVGEPQLERRRPVLLVGPRLQLARRRQRGQLLLSGAARLAAGHARHLAGLDRQHRQPADDERDLPAAAADDRGAEMGQGDDGRRRAAQQAVQRLRAARTIRCRSSSSGRTRPGRRAC